LWAMPIPNTLKESLWRAAVNATSGSHISPWVCPCCGPPSPVSRPRSHTLWDCPAALAVRQAIASAGVPLSLLTKESVWLLRPPALPALSQPIWLSVCAAAIDAMDYSRRAGWALRHASAGARPQPPVSLPHLAVARFWCNLSDIADARPPGLLRLPRGALFFGFGGSGRLTALVPAGVAGS